MAQKAKKNEEQGLLVSAAKTIGKAAGTIAAASGLAPQSIPEVQPRKRRVKLTPKNKSRLPRRQKKAQKKVSAA